MHSVHSFVQRVEGWFPSVGSHAILIRVNLELYAEQGIQAFIQAFGGPNGDRFCHFEQISATVNFIYSVLAAAFHNTPGQGIITQ